jgi:DNA-binding transcriptional MocR family regulator
VLVARGRPAPGGLIADASVRIVAAELAVAKNTAQRALKSLRAAAVVEPAQGRSGDGRFATASYLLSIPAEMLPSSGAPQPPKQQAARRPAPPARAASAVEQLVLVPSE